MNCNTTHYRANSSSVPGDPTPDLAQPHARLAQLHAEAGRHHAALAEYREALRCAPGCALARLGIARSLLALGQREPALTTVAAVVHDHPAYYPAHIAHGHVLERSGDGPAALDALAKAIAIGNQAAWPRVARAESLIRLQRHDEALADLDAAAALEPDNPTVHRLRGQTLLALGRGQQAIPALERALASEPAMTACWRQLAEAHWSNGDHDAAERAIAIALKLAPDDEATLQLASRLRGDAAQRALQR